MPSRGARVIQLRDAKGWRQIDLAKKAGVAEKTIRRIEQESHQTHAATLQKVAVALGVELEDLDTQPDDPRAGQLDRIEAQIAELTAAVEALGRNNSPSTKGDP